MALDRRAGGKATYVSLSWLNYWLIDADLKLPALTGMVFLVGLAMFMLPIVPGTAVYLFSGLLVASGTAFELGRACCHSQSSKEIALFPGGCLFEMNLLVVSGYWLFCQELMGLLNLWADNWKNVLCFSWARLPL